MNISYQIKRDIKSHALSEKPNECCGLILKTEKEYLAYPCKNIAEDKCLHFIMDYHDYYAGSKLGKIEFLYHSQPTLIPSNLDIQNCKVNNLKSVIYSYNDDDFTYLDPLMNFSINKYVGRDFEIGKMDCFTLVRDYYENELKISISNYERSLKSLLKDKDIIINNYQKEGFVIVKDKLFQKHDLLVFKQNKNFPGHLAIYLDNKLFLHQWRNSKSNIKILTDELKNHITMIMRHKSLW